NLLESALGRPYATFEGIDLYETDVDKAAAILESIVINHPFVDGNKRTGYVLMRLLLMQSGFDIIVSQDDKYTFVIEVTEGKHTIDSIKSWINQHLAK
uniref:type II toxin-antitoxin system death-on-curing family toxin n=1 Tax=uncultured Flavobacterium sp. TaxID=165435 RepID=UPI0025E8A41E